MKRELIIYKLKDLAKRHFYVLVLFLLTLIFFSGVLGSSRILENLHYINDMTFQSGNVAKYLLESGAFPLWTPYFYSGQPFMAIPEHYIFDLNFLYIFLTKNIFLAMNLAVISYFFLAGLGMYLLIYEITRNQKAAFIAAIVFMFNGFMQKFILNGHLNILESYALLPFVILFTYRAVHKKSWLNNSIIAALFLSMMIYAGGVIFFLYAGLIIGLYLVWSLVGRNFKKKLIKTIFVSFAIIILLLGLSALKLLPVLEFTKMSSRGLGVSYQEFLGRPIDLNNSFNLLINIFPEFGFSGAIGFSAFILLLLGLLAFRKKIIMFSILLIILSILLATGTFIAKFFYQLPGFGQMRHIERALVIFVFAAPIIAAYGYTNLINYTKSYKKNIREIFIFLPVSIILIMELMFLQQFPKSIEIVRPNDIAILDEISKDKDDFRIATYGLSTPIGASGYNYYMQLGIPAIKGGGGIWINDYVQFLAIAQQIAPSKMFGILNGKYVTSTKEIDDTGLLLKGSFQDCKDCPVWEAYGPFLYENQNVIPRALIVNNGVLLLGNEDDRRDFSYNLIIQSLDPLSTVLIQDKNTINGYNIDELTKFNAIILLRGSANQNDIPKLQQYADNGGKILPDLLEGENSISQTAISDTFSPDDFYKELKMNMISVNEFSVDIDGQKGWLVLSERFAHFPGWEASLNGNNLKLYKADNVISAVYLDGERGQLTFKYSPDSFRRGKLITIATILILLIYFIYIAYTRMKS